MSISFFKNANQAQHYATTDEVQVIFDKLNAELQGVKIDCFRHIDDCCSKLHQDVQVLSASVSRLEAGAVEEGINKANVAQTNSEDFMRRSQEQIDRFALVEEHLQSKLQAHDVDIREIREVNLRGLDERSSVLAREVWAQGSELREAVEGIGARVQSILDNQRGLAHGGEVAAHGAEVSTNQTNAAVLQELQIPGANTCHSLPVTPEDSPRVAAPLKPRSRRRTTIFRLPHDQGTVRIPRCTAPPATFRDLPSTATGEPCPVWDEFGDGSDKDGMMTPPAGALVSSSFTPPDGHANARNGCDDEEQENSLITPDGVSIVLMEGSCEVEMEGVAGCTSNPAMEIVVGPQGFRPPRKSRLSIVMK